MSVLPPKDAVNRHAQLVDRSVLLICACDTARMCRLSTQITGKPASARARKSPCDNGSASRPIRLKAPSAIARSVAIRAERCDSAAVSRPSRCSSGVAPAHLTSRKLRPPQNLNRRRPLARPIPTGPPRRSMFASTTRAISGEKGLFAGRFGRGCFPCERAGSRWERSDTTPIGNNAQEGRRGASKRPSKQGSVG
jgi:hypothetical protein